MIGKGVMAAVAVASIALATSGCTVVPAQCCAAATTGAASVPADVEYYVGFGVGKRITGGASTAGEPRGGDADASGLAAPQKILAVGYGAMGIYSSQLTAGQQRLMAMRAARLDAYRNLAEQVSGFRVWGSSSVSAFATQNDNVRTYVDAFIRGARVVNMTITPDGNYEATVELELTPEFAGCVTGRATTACGTNRTIGSGEFCDGSGCVQPAAYYYTH